MTLFGDMCFPVTLSLCYHRVAGTDGLLTHYYFLVNLKLALIHLCYGIMEINFSRD